MTQLKNIQRMIAFSAAIMLTASLGACEGPLPAATTVQSQEQTATPVLTAQQEESIRARILEVIEQANTSRNTEGLSAVMSGPALAIRTSEITVAGSDGTLDAKTAIPAQVDQVIIPTTDAWPRTVYAITTTTEDQQSRRLLVLRQDNAHENYKLWAVARLFPNVTLPKFEIASIGSTQGTAHDEGLVLTPQEAVTAYADVLTSGDSSSYATQFADDYFRQQLQKLQASVQTGIAENNGSQEQLFSPVEGNIAVMRSTDGGDLVVAELTSVWTRNAGGEDYQSLPASNAERALFGETEATSIIRVTYDNVVVLYVPKADDNQAISAVAAERQPISVVAG